MNEPRPHFVFLNGFDRSGTSMMAKVLSCHPSIECLFQPFSSTVVHDTEWAYWSALEEHPKVESFLDGLQKGQLDTSFIASDWFANHSTAFEIRPGTTYVIKSTKLHFKVDWLGSHYPSVPVYAIERNPHGILASLLRNGFYEKWYGEEAYQSLLEYAEVDDKLPCQLQSHVERAATDLEKMAVMVAVRTVVAQRSIPRERTLVYEDVLEDAETEFDKLVDPLGLSSYPFSEHVDQDYNIAGKQYRRHDLWKDYFSEDEKQIIHSIFSSF